MLLPHPPDLLAMPREGRRQWAVPQQLVCTWQEWGWWVRLFVPGLTYLPCHPRTPHPPQNKRLVTAHTDALYGPHAEGGLASLVATLGVDSRLRQPACLPGLVQPLESPG